ncbi:molybdopterin molybdotransferase MoeA [Thiohalobacter thiocyanaticus]|uniref:Molybdopterin molybdenumtransferase n=1 Tax=Thiohalobacter thiocyanaticus TaxID=585455 RepID=A0A426QLR4_9GAMM|nr:gephyrin-like molybdotransferase Glp [Thiohalobacter thiocyanaticus]RRQ22701.1 molybdopterin molybdenumtransferase MoeA [Thiohalobacter thiocyanaticus]
MTASNQDPDPCATPEQKLLSVEEARQRILDAVAPVTGDEVLPLRSALGRVLAEPLHAGIDVPGFANSAMDGYAVRGADLAPDGTTELQLTGQAMAGAPFAGQVEAGQAVRIMTGAVLPEGADTVVMQERVEVDGDRVRIGAGQKAGANVRHPGEDIRAGERVLEAGTRLLPPQLGVIASLGQAEARVRRRLRVAFFSTGDELVGLGRPLGPGQIYDSNRYSLHAMLTRLGVEVIDLGVIPDTREAVRAAFTDAAAQADAVITSGGVSVGEADYVKETLEAMGEVDFWRIAMKPGKPLAIGRLGGARFFGLPGNPVSVMATFYQFTQPALEKMMGTTPSPPPLLQARTAAPLKKSPGRLEFQRGWMESAEDGGLQVRPTGGQGSHLMTSMSRANCFIILPAESNGVEAGETVQVQPFAGLV